MQVYRYSSEVKIVKGAHAEFKEFVAGVECCAIPFLTACVLARAGAFFQFTRFPGSGPL